MLINKKRKKGIFILLAFLWATVFLSAKNLNNQNYIYDDRNFEFEKSKNSLKFSGSYTNITINDLPGSPNNWAWAKTQPWCSGSGTLLDPYLIEDHILKMYRRMDGIHIENSISSYFIIRNCTLTWDTTQTNTVFMTGVYLGNTTNGQIVNNIIYHLGKGIHLNHSNTVKIVNNTIYDHPQEGILLETSNFNNVSENILYDNDDGISLQDSNNNIIIGNTANNSKYNGIYMFDYCGYNTISNNFVNSTRDYGISLHWYCQNNTIIDNTANYNGEIGIEIYDYSSNNTISNNVASYNGLDGIGIFDFSNNNTLTKNILYNNTIGVYIDNGDNNSIYENFFLKNVKHAFDDGTDNNWNSTIIGNYWDNHTSPDVTPVDGIVDNPYTYISGAAGSTDYLPIAEDGAPRITINSPIEGGKFGSTAPSFNVEIIDVYIYEMWYTIDGGLHNYTFTENGTINQAAWDALPEGSVTITFYARDIIGNEASEEVTVIKGISAGGLEPGVIIIIVVVSVVGGIAIIGAAYIFLKKRKAPA